MKIPVKIQEGFEGQKAIVVPRTILQNNCENNPLIQGAFITDIGFYPKATHHYRQRLQGAVQHILIYCHKGSGEATIAEKKYNIQAGDFIIIPAGVPHTYAADKTAAWTIYWMHFNGTTTDALAKLMVKHLNGYKGHLQHSSQSITLFDKMYQQLERGYHEDNLIYCNLLLQHYFATFLYNDKEDITPQPLYQDTIDKAIDFLKSNVHRTITLAEIASAVNLSPSHFSTLFKKKSGFTPVDYFNQLKMQQACRYLLFTDLRIKEIADLLGITDVQYFSRLFSKIMGKSPSEYREKRIH